MITGHGDDTYLYSGIQMNFSSNIFAHAEMSELKAHLCRHIDLIGQYPEPIPQTLAGIIADKHDISPDRVLVTNGATEAIYLIAQAAASLPCTHFCTGGLPTFSEYEDASALFGLQRQELLEASAGPTLLWLCNPNNPTGHVYATSEILGLARRYAYAVVDQSYEHLTLAPMMTPAEAAASANIIQIHSLTKTYAIPGLRIGYIVAAPEVVQVLRRHVRPWSVNALAIEAGIWLMEHGHAAVCDLAEYLGETQRLRRQLNLVPGIKAFPTQTNFILAESSLISAARLKELLASRHHILIRDASNFRGLSPCHFRVSTQTREENDCLVEAISEVTSSLFE